MVKNETKTEAIVGLFVNLLIPGVGTIIGATKQKEYMNSGVIQLILTLVAIPLCLLIVGFFLGFAMWIWALVTSIQMLSE